MRDGLNMWENKDVNGNYWVQEIIAKAKELKQNDSFSYFYKYINPDNTKPFPYFPVWYICACNL